MNTTFRIPSELLSNPLQLINYVAVEIAESLLPRPEALAIKRVEEILQQFEALIKQQAVQKI